MSEGFTVQSSHRTYQVLFVLDFAGALLGALRDGDVILVDRKVQALHPEVFRALPANVRVLAFEATEDQKSYQGVTGIIEQLIEWGFKKNHRLVAVGGGIIQDVTAFIASILFRGVEWLFFPTTLLAQCDSCIGSKTSINFGRHKNQIGNFYPPWAIFIHTGFLETLPDFAIRSGIGEMAHYFLVSGREDFELLRDHMGACRQDRLVMNRLIRRSLEIKKGYVERDEFDQGPRQVFNYGHSFGHALESVTEYAIPHGIAVSFGMDIANFLSCRLGLIPETLRLELRALLCQIWEGSSVDGIDVRAFERALSKDKKNVGSELRVILTRGLGAMYKSPLALDATVSGWLDEWFRDWRSA